MSWDPINVSAERPYPVLVCHGNCRLLPEFLDGIDKVAIIHADNLLAQAQKVAGTLTQQVTFIPVPGSESAKTTAVLAQCWEALAEAGITRSDAIIGIGGGSTTDLAGFAAATWLRGVRYLALPTSLLAMVDAAVGGKTGINLPAGKNLVGNFFEPFAVLCDLDFLETLPEAELHGGMAEVLKAGFVSDPRILDEFEADPVEALRAGSELQARLVRLAVEVKARVVSADLRERTSEGSDIGRELLNYGHTLGHAIERYERFTWRHGEAISVGMVFAAELAHRQGMIDDELLARHRRVLSLAGLPISHDGEWAGLREAMNLDKKTRGANLRFILLRGLAKAQVCVDPNEQLLADAYAALVD